MSTRAPVLVSDGALTTAVKPACLEKIAMTFAITLDRHHRIKPRRYHVNSRC